MLQQDISQVRRDFYDGLYVYSLLQSDTVRRVKSDEQELPRSKTTRKRKIWQIFLDDLCLLCGSHPGRITTTAIAVEQRADKAVIWVASNSKTEKLTTSHLQVTLNIIKLGSEDSKRETECTSLIFEKAVDRSPQRVHNYAGRLLSAVRSLETEVVAAHGGDYSCTLGLVRANADSLSDLDLRMTMENLVSLCGDHKSLCKEAHRLRQTPTVKAFLKHARNEKYDSWFQIHHYLAHFGSWFRAAYSVVRLGHRFADILAHFSVRYVRAGPRLDCRPLDFEADPQIVLNRVYPNYKDTNILANALSRIQGASKLAERYQLRPPIPRPHAESKILNHFFLHGFELVKGDRYVGCSKSSCYCCRQYFRYHPAKARIGRTHKNVWIKWSLPSSLTRDHGEVDRESLRMMRLMADTIRNEITALILAQGTPLVAMFDSTTGLTVSTQAFTS